MKSVFYVACGHRRSQGGCSGCRILATPMPVEVPGVHIHFGGNVTFVFFAVFVLFDDMFVTKCRQ